MGDVSEILNVLTKWRAEDQATAAILAGAKKQQAAMKELEQERNRAIQHQSRMDNQRYRETVAAMKRQAAEVKKIGDEAERSDGKIAWLNRRLMSIGVAMAASLAVYKVKELISDTLSLNMQLEQSRLGVAAILYNASNASLIPGVGTFQKAQAMSKDLYRQMELDAVKTLATTQEYAEIWQSLSAPIFKAHGGIEGVNEATKLTIATARMLNMPLDIASFSIKQMLLGMIDSRDQLASLFRLTSKEINELKNHPEQSFALVMSKLRENSEAASASADTMMAKWTAFQDIVNQIKRAIGDEMFKEAKKSLDNMARWWKTNKEEVLATARIVGQDLVGAVKAIVGFVREVHDHWDAISTTIKTIATIWIAKESIAAIGLVITKVSELYKLLLAIKTLGIANLVLGGTGAAMAAGGGGAAVVGAGEAAAGGGATAWALARAGAAKEAAASTVGWFGRLLQSGSNLAIGASGAVGGMAIADKFANVMEQRRSWELLEAQRVRDEASTGRAAYEQLKTALPEEMAYMIEKYATMLDSKRRTEESGLRENDWGPALTGRPTIEAIGKLTQAIETNSDVQAQFGNFVKWMLPSLNYGPGNLGGSHGSLESPMSFETDANAPGRGSGGFAYRPYEQFKLPDKKEPKIHFHGAHFEIKVDARHQDPDRVAASIIKQVGKTAANGRTQSRAARGHMTAD